MKTKKVVSIDVSDYPYKIYFNNHTEAGYYIDTHPNVRLNAPEEELVLENESKCYCLKKINISYDESIAKLDKSNIHEVFRHLNYSSDPSAFCFISTEQQPGNQIEIERVKIYIDNDNQIYYLGKPCIFINMPDYSPVKTFVDKACVKAAFFQPPKEQQLLANESYVYRAPNL